MVTKNKLSIALTASLLFTAGCSGARLKNLIGRNDYQTLEELEREDSAYADLYDDADDTDSRFVSQTRDIDDPVDPVDDFDETEDRPSRFSLSRLFGRDKDDDYAAMEDPFAGTLEDRRAVDKLNEEIKQLREQMKQRAAEESRPVVAQAADRAAQAVDRAADYAAGGSGNPAGAADTTDRYVASLDEVEQQAEAMFDDLSEATDGAYDRTARNPFARASESRVLEETVERTSESFADFLNQTGGDEPSNPFAAGVQGVQAQVDEFRNDDQTLNFDALVSETDRDAAFADAVARQQELFPEAGDVFADALGMASESAAAPPVPAEVAVPADLASAAEKHGFAPLKKQDPWAAFAAGQQIADAAPPVPAADTASGFQWGQPAHDASPVSMPEAPIVETGDVLQVSTDGSPFVAPSPSTDPPLMIPAQVPSEQPVIELPTNSAAGSLEDPFLTETGFADLERIPDADLSDPPQAKAGPLESGSSDVVGTGAPATITTTPNRLWFFVLGCVALAALLFLPSRQSQKN